MNSPINQDPLLRAFEIVSRPEVTPEQAEVNRSKGRDLRQARAAQHGILPIALSTWNLWRRKGRAPAPSVVINDIPMWKLSDIHNFFGISANTSAQK
ncbi:MAG: hypothetical protein IPH41_17290 [Sulfuritalea sp.]|nr:hypothetical protein [Sulfuritalea sp.]